MVQNPLGVNTHYRIMEDGAERDITRGEAMKLLAKDLIYWCPECGDGDHLYTYHATNNGWSEIDATHILD